MRRVQRLWGRAPVGSSDPKKEIPSFLVIEKGKNIVCPAWRHAAARRGAGIALRTILNTESLRRGAIQRLFFTRVKTNLNDHTTSISTLILKDPNATALKYKYLNFMVFLYFGKMAA